MLSFFRFFLLIALLVLAIMAIAHAQDGMLQ